MSETGEYNTQGPDPTVRPPNLAPDTPNTDVAAPQFPEVATEPYSPGWPPTPPPEPTSTAGPQPAPPSSASPTPPAPADRPAPAASSPVAPSPVVPSPVTASPVTPAPVSPRSDQRWRSFVAPGVAAAVLVLGMVFLMVRGTGDATTAREPDRDVDNSVAETNEVEPDETTVTTLAATTTTAAEAIPPSGPRPTPPPLVEPPIVTTETEPDVTPPASPAPVPSPPTETTLPTVAGPTLEDVRSALLLPSDITGAEWFSEPPPESQTLCGDNPDDDNVVHREQAYFARAEIDPIAVLQLSHTLYTFPDEATATRSFNTDVALLSDCAIDSLDVDGTTYELAINVDRFDEEDAAAFPCSDDNVLIITQLNSAGATVPFLGEISAVFRCGQVVSVVSFSSSIDLGDLQDNDYFSAVAATNSRAAELASA